MKAPAPIPVLRIARHCRDPFALAARYVAALGFVELGRFNDHDGFDGIMVGWPRAGWHLEFVAAPHPRANPPEREDALVLYFPDAGEWGAARAAALAAGFTAAAAGNPYWEENGASFDDAEGFRLILARQQWKQ